MLSIASVWEIAIKFSLGKLVLDKDFDRIQEFLDKNYIQILSLNISHTERLLELPHFYRDPFDRIIIAQAITENVTIITKDKVFTSYPVKAIW